ncbi:MAG: hypothetical protein WC565_08125 [Parcubacteria group bacterium]
MNLESEPRPDRAGLISGVAAPKGNKVATEAYDTQADKVKPGRSSAYPTHFRVGRKGTNRVFWHPVTKYAEDVPGTGLRPLADLEGVLLFQDGADLIAMHHAVEASCGRLREAMDRELRGIVDAYEHSQAVVDESLLQCEERVHVAATEAW